MVDYNPQIPTRAGIPVGHKHAIGIADTVDNSAPGAVLFVHVSGDEPIDPVRLTISDGDQETFSTDFDAPVGTPGWLFVARPTERPSGRYVIETEFDGVIADLSDYVDAAAMALTTVSAGDYATYDDANTRWQQGGTLAAIPDVALAPGATWTVGNDFPDKPSNFDVHFFGAAVASDLSDYVDGSGTALTSAAAGDYARYDEANTQWVMLGNLSGVTAALTVGTAFPLGPSDGDVHVFSPKTNVPSITVDAIKYVRGNLYQAGAVVR